MEYTGVFGLVDFIIFGLTLGLSVSIGIYFGCFGSKQKSAKEYVSGTGQIQAIPVGMSLYSSAISAVTIIGTPTEIYTFGTQFFMINIGVFFSLFITWNFVLPVFCGELNIKTPYEYIEKRFSYKVRILSSLIYILHTLLYMPVVLYAATMAFSESTGFPLVICSSLIGGACIFYTVLGGFTTVIWTDTLQATLMLGSCIFVMIKGLYDSGGISEVWKVAEQGGRIQFFDMDPNPFKRTSFWSTIFGFALGHSAHNGCGASAIQRFIALRNEKQARIATLIGVLGVSTIGVVASIIGLNMYAHYYNCDPVANGDLDSPKNMVAHYVNDIIGNIPGFTGFFSAGLFCAGLSTLSAELNTVGGLIYYDIIEKIYKNTISDTRGALIMKFIILINGLYYLTVIPLIDQFEHIFPLALSIGGLTYGGKIGLMILGTAFPKTNSTGAICGVLSGIVVIGFITFGALYNNVGSGYALSVSTDDCLNNTLNQLYNVTTVPNKITNHPFFLFQLSFLYYPVLGVIITIIVGLGVSYITGPNDISQIDQRLLIPRLRVNKEELYTIECEQMLKT